MSKFIMDENGQGMIEYALIIGVIAVVAIVALIAIRSRVQTKFEAVNQNLAKS